MLVQGETHLKEISQWEVNCDMILLDVEGKNVTFSLSKEGHEN